MAFIVTRMRLNGRFVKNFNPVARWFLRLPKLLLPPKILDSIASIVAREQRKRIRDQKQVGGAALRPLSPVTWKLKKSRLKLFETGDLLHSIRPYNKGSKRAVATNVSYAAKLDEGDGGRLKPFNYFGVDDQMRKQVYDYLDKKFEEIFTERIK